MSTLWVWLDIYWKFSSLQHTHDLRQRPILASTPIVRGHAEACPSTTRTKIYVERVSLGAGVFLHNGGSCACGEGPWRAPGISDFLTFTYPSKILGSRKLAVRFGWNLAHVPPSARWRWFPTDVLLAKHFLLTKITVFGVKFSTFFKFHLISRHGYTLALPNLADESLQTVSGMLCEIFSSIGLKLEEI